MNKQRKVLITITYNEMGIIIDTKAEELGSSAQTEIVRCRDCKYGEQDEIGRWYCRGLGCQMGDDDGNGFCSDAEKREE